MWLVFLFLMGCLWGENQHETDPVFAGTLLNEYSENVPPGRLEIEPYLFARWKYGSYKGNWKEENQDTQLGVILLNDIEAGISRHFDLSVVMNAQYERVNGKGSVRYGDIQSWLGVQLARDVRGGWCPDVRFLVGESFPTGKHDRLDPNLLLSDSSGTGAFTTVLIGVVGKIFRPTWSRPWKTTLNVWWMAPMKTTVHGVSIYGGEVGKKSVVRPGKSLIVDLGVEYAVVGNWEILSDFRWESQGRSRVVSGNQEGVGTPSSELFSMAPGFAYNFNDSFSIYGVTHFSVAGRNDDAFFTGIFSVYYEF